MRTFGSYNRAMWYKLRIFSGHNRISKFSDKTGCPVPDKQAAISGAIGRSGVSLVLQYIFIYIKDMSLSGP
jgi:hypothetical protein